MSEPSSNASMGILLGAVVLTAALGWFAWKSSRKELTRPSQPLLPPYPDLTLQDSSESDMMVTVVNPQGQYMNVLFTSDEWSMIREVQSHSGDDINEIVIDIIAGRIRNNTLGF